MDFSLDFRVDEVEDILSVHDLRDVVVSPPLILQLKVLLGREIEHPWAAHFLLDLLEGFYWLLFPLFQNRLRNIGLNLPGFILRLNYTNSPVIILISFECILFVLFGLLQSFIQKTLA